MRVLLVHNYYGSSAPSGENRVFEAERDLLVRHGVTVRTFTRRSDEIRGKGVWGLVKGALCTVANPFAAFRLRRVLRAFRPDVVHFHNTFPLISPFAVWIVKRMGAPVVLTLHNYRLWCAAGIPLHGSQVCTRCLDSGCVWDALRHRCYRRSFLATLPLALSIALWRRVGVWTSCVDRFVCLTSFAAGLAARAGLPRARLAVKGNFQPDHPHLIRSTPNRRGVLFVGRLTLEKGVSTLVTAWNRLGGGAPSLTVIGAGEARVADEAAVSSARVRFVGPLSHDEVLSWLAAAQLVVIPSLCYEGLPTTLVEAFMCGTPCLVSDRGPLPNLVTAGVDGAVFRAGDAKDLAAKVRGLFADPAHLAALGRGARRTYEATYTEERNYRRLMEIYQECQA